MESLCGCGTQCRGVCENLRFSDDEPGNVHRMEKTKLKNGVWAGARALIEHDEFPSLLEASKLRRGTHDLNRENTKWQYAWGKWMNEIAALCEKPKLPPSCERMVRVLHCQFHYDIDQMAQDQFAAQVAKAVMELEFRRSERERGVHSPFSEFEPGNETTLMTRVRSATKHKVKPVSKHILRIIERCYPLVARVTTSPPIQHTEFSPPPPPLAPEPAHTPDGSVSAHMQPAYGCNLELFLDVPIFSDLGGATNNNISCPPNLLFTPPSHVTLPAEGPDGNERDSCEGIEPVPGLTSNPIRVQGGDDPLFPAYILCIKGEIQEAVQCYKFAIQCEQQRITSEWARASGLTPWYYMWLKLGEAVKRREDIAERRGRPACPTTSQVLCALDPVFGELECDRDYGEFGPEAQATLEKAIAEGNFAAKATKGLLMLGAEADVGGTAGFGNEYGDDKETREIEGLKLVLDAMRTDQWTVPRFLVQLIKDRHIPLSNSTMHTAVEEMRKRADKCSITSFHMGSLLAYEMAIEVGYRHNVADAKKALQSCMYGVHVTSEIRLHCVRKLGKLATFGVGGVGVDLEMAERVLKKGVEANDTFCIQHLANVRLRQKEAEAAAELFQELFRKDEWEVFISAKPGHASPAWVTYRIHILEQWESHFLSDVRNGACFPSSIQQDRISGEYGELMLIEFHEFGLKNS